MPNAKKISVSRIIPASPEDIFDVLTTPAGHAAIDGSGSVVAPKDGDQRLGLGDEFGMSMKFGIPYSIKNEVVEYETNRLIAWQHYGKHRWRYELEPVDGGTAVTETFDWSTSFAPWLIELLKWPQKHPESMRRTLERLEQHLVSPTA